MSGKEITDDDLAGSLFAENGHWLAAHMPRQGSDVFEEGEDERLDRALRACLETLPTNLRSAVEMKYLLEMKSDAIREALGISDANYWQQVHRGKLKLRACLEERLNKRR